MIIVKKKNLFILAALFCFLLVFGEVKFFLVLKGTDLAKNLQIKYEVENFIFASIVLTLTVGVFILYFVRKSNNILRQLDKLIELSEYGEQDITGHLKKLGELGRRVDFLLHFYKELNRKKTVKISSISGINNFLIEKNNSPVFLLNRHGNVVNCSDRLLSALGIDREKILKRNANEIFENLTYEQLFFELEKKRNFIEIDDARMSIEGAESTNKIHFHPIVNSDNQISHIIGVME
ncbi:MAG: PAS domain-containing protein [Candidatus Omnitrophota bacterium]